MSTEPLLSVRNLRIGFGSPRAETQVVHGVSFDLYRGEAVAIVGESGSGKSVTARSLIGLAGPTARVRASRLAFHGADLLRQSERDWQGIRGNRIGFVLQDALVSLDPLRSVGSEVEEVLARHTDLNRAQRRSAAIDALGRAGIPDPELRATQLPGQLSGGLRQRALIASAIAADPDLVIADEPTTALDVTVQAQVLDLLREQVDAGRSLLLISHDLAVVSRVADRVIVVQHGRIVEEGPAEQVLTAPSHSYTKQLLQAVPSVHSKGTRLSNEPPPAYIERIARPDSELGSPVVLRGDGLVKSFASAGAPRVAVSDVTFTLRRGETLGVVGESGSGKSTLARMALGLERPDRGSVEVGGRRWADLRGRDLRSARLNIQAISQDALGTFDPRHTVGASLREALGASGVRGRAELRSRSVELLRLVGLTEAHLDRRPLSLSGGQRQRVAIARALAPRPDILVCDEPVSSLDVSLQAQVLDLLADVQAATGVALLFISHDLGVIYHVSDRVLVMRDGCAVEEGTVAEVFANPRHPYTRELIAAIPRPEPLRLH